VKPACTHPPYRSIWFVVIHVVIFTIWFLVNSKVFPFFPHFDPYPFILLNLAFSTQAAYAAPLILLAQNRQADRDRAEIERDRETNARTQADAEYLARVDWTPDGALLVQVMNREQKRLELRRIGLGQETNLPLERPSLVAVFIHHLLQGRPVLLVRVGPDPKAPARVESGCCFYAAVASSSFEVGTAAGPHESGKVSTTGVGNRR